MTSFYPTSPEFYFYVQVELTNTNGPSPPIKASGHRFPSIMQAYCNVKRIMAEFKDYRLRPEFDDTSVINYEFHCKIGNWTEGVGHPNKYGEFANYSQFVAGIEDAALEFLHDIVRRGLEAFQAVNCGKCKCGRAWKDSLSTR